MLGPEGAQVQNETVIKEDNEKDVKNSKKGRKLPTEGAGSLELKSYKNPKTWKKSLSQFFYQLRSTKSNEGDGPSGSKDNFKDKDISPDQKWQSLGKIFRRQSFAEHWNKSTNQGEGSSQSKRLAVRKVLSTYFTKTHKTSDTNEDD